MASDAVRRPVVAVVGSIDPARADKLGLRDIDRAPAACEALGRALAEKDVDIVVYSGDPQFVEGHVVRGYVAGAPRTRRAAIRVCAPQRKQGELFPEVDDHAELFDVRPDPHDDWEVSYYRSVIDADAVLLIGGGRSTQITGLIALSLDKAVLAVAGFGGHAQRVWRALDRGRHDAEPDEIDRMGSAWRDDLAAPLVAALLAQCRRRAERQEAARRDARRDARQAVAGLLAGLVLLVLAVATIPLSRVWQPGTVPVLGLLVGAPLLAAAAGSTVRNATDRSREWLRTVVLGTAAGAVTGLLFVAAQLVTTPDVLVSGDGARLLFFLLPVGFIAGLTFDDVYHKLRSEDVARTEVLKK